MAGLGRYKVMPELTGGFFVKHDSSRSLSRSYENIALFQQELQKYDWKVMFEAVKIGVDIVRQIYVGHYFNKNRQFQNDALARLTKDFHAMQKMNPVELGALLNYIGFTLPLFARTSQERFNKPLNDCVAIASEYYKRHLAKYETHENNYMSV